MTKNNDNNNVEISNEKQYKFDADINQLMKLIIYQSICKLLTNIEKNLLF